MTKRILASLLCLLMIAALAFGCQKAPEAAETPASEAPSAEEPAAEAPAEPAEPMEFTMLYSSEVSSLNYLIEGAQNEQIVGANVIDTLVEYDRLGNIIPGLAESWESNADATVWTFHLRQGVKWYDYQGNEVAEVTAQNFVDAAKYVSTAEYDSSTQYMIGDFVVNAQAYYDGEITDFSEVGVKAIDDYTLEYTLNGSAPFFLTCLTYVCYMPAYGPMIDELGLDFGTANDKILFCGSYILSEFEPQVKHVYTKNVNNWDAANIHIEKITKLYNTESATLAPTMVQRGEIDYADIPNDIVDDWMANNPELLSMDRAIPDYSYFFCFNFDPTYDDLDASWDQENWRTAVYNENFRQSIMAALDRNYIYSVWDPAGTQSALLQHSFTPKTFTQVDGVDFTNLDPFAPYTEGFMDTAKALDYKAKAMEELSGSVNFPVTVVLTYKSNDTDWQNEMTLMEQQLEGVLGTDYIDCVLYAGPSESFLSQTRRAGKYSIQKCNWGADYEDPSTFAAPFNENIDSETGLHAGNSYNKMDKALDGDSDFAATVATYYDMVQSAKDTTDQSAKLARYEAFAKAEAYLIEHAVMIPYYISPAAYVATRIDAFQGEYAPCGVSTLRYKYETVADEYITMDQYSANYETWLTEFGG